ncbi:MAG: DMT family transporter [Pseudomonadales bacterium]
MLISIASLCFALYLLFSKPLVEKLGSRLFTCIALLSASVAILLFAFSQGSFAQGNTPSAQGLWLIFLIAVFCTVIPSFFTSEAIARIGAERTSIAAMTGPIVTSIAAVAVLGELFTLWHALGIALVVVGIARLK